jgi:hypothetical protein
LGARQACISKSCQGGLLSSQIAFIGNNSFMVTKFIKGQQQLDVSFF